jgi:hypothetical protein
MKGLFTAITLFALLTLSAAAQPETLIKGEVDHGGYGGVVARTTELNGTLGVMGGGTGGWIIDHTFAIGLSGYGVATGIPANDPASPKPSYLKLGYGGLDLNYIYRSNDLVHVTGGVLLGAGGMQFSSRSPGDEIAWGDQEPERASDAFWVVEPGVNAEVNLASYMRVNLGGSYRFFSGA